MLMMAVQFSEFKTFISPDRGKIRLPAESPKAVMVTACQSHNVLTSVANSLHTESLQQLSVSGVVVAAISAALAWLTLPHWEYKDADNRRA